MVHIEISDSTYKQLQLLAQSKEQTIDETLSDLLSTSAQPSIKQQLEFLDLAADAVVTINPDSFIVAFNAGAEKLFGYQAIDIIGEPLSLLLPGAIRDIHQHNVDYFLDADIHSRYMADRQPLQAMKRDGMLFWADISLAKFHVEDQLYVIAIVRDVTQMQSLVAELREKESRLRLLTDNATDLICLHAPDGTYEFVSQSAMMILGYNPEDLLGQNPYDYFHPDDIPAIMVTHQSSRSGQEGTRITYRFKTVSGEYIWFETITHSIYEDGTLVNLVTTSRDVTETVRAQAELKHERDFVSSILELSPAAVTVVSADGQITLSNKRAETVLGIRKDKINTRTYNAPDWQHTDYDGNPWPDEKQPFVKVMETKAPVWDIRHAIEKPDGERIYLAINGMPMFDEQGEIEQIIFTVEDYTDRKLQQDELEAALERQQQLNQMRSKFLSIVSHEFKTPLSVIMTSTSLLRLKHGVITQEQFQARLTKIENQVRRLVELIDDVTFINKENLVGHKNKPVAIHVGEFLRGIITDLEPEYPGVTSVGLQEPPEIQYIMIDKQMAHFIFDNLISNAMKYSGEQGIVNIAYSVEDHQLTVLVSDNGIGIPEEDQRNLFDLFHRAGNVGKIRGTGLGLSIVKSCVDTLGGAISFESAVNQGTTFVVTLPVEELALT